MSTILPDEEYFTPCKIAKQSDIALNSGKSIGFNTTFGYSDKTIKKDPADRKFRISTKTAKLVSCDLEPIPKFTETLLFKSNNKDQKIFEESSINDDLDDIDSINLNKICYEKNLTHTATKDTTLKHNNKDGCNNKHKKNLINESLYEIESKSDISLEKNDIISQNKSFEDSHLSEYEDHDFDEQTVKNFKAPFDRRYFSEAKLVTLINENDTRRLFKLRKGENGFNLKRLGC